MVRASPSLKPLLHASPPSPLSLPFISISKYCWNKAFKCAVTSVEVYSGNLQETLTWCNLNLEKPVKQGLVWPPPLTICMCLNFVLPILVPPAESNWNDRKSLFCPVRKEFWSSNLKLPNALWQNMYWNSFLFPHLLKSGTYLSQISKLLTPCVFTSINIPRV